MRASKLTKTFLLLFVFVGIVSCASKDNYEYNPKEKQVLSPEIQIPSGYFVDNMEQNYSIPDIVTDRSDSKVSSLEPPEDVQ